MEDCLYAISFVVDHAEEFGIDTSKIALIGDSAGGALVVSVLGEALRLPQRYPWVRNVRHASLVYPSLCRGCPTRSHLLYAWLQLLLSIPSTPEANELQGIHHIASSPQLSLQQPNQGSCSPARGTSKGSNIFAFLCFLQFSSLMTYNMKRASYSMKDSEEPASRQVCSSLPRILSHMNTASVGQHAVTEVKNSRGDENSEEITT
ncbi:alpha/beta hydrolase fold domain containing protein, putative [Eimeria praecox]|uniref:Alpha/beta hydrolase fold domain containing protein, putative n=1 Tax=Eimeria praecox TaxID=51316 RepID=U6G360_9EIME|nr:alpha/beta hydrolase fold domain containing protein, putative [Eimeria praecox]